MPNDKEYICKHPNKNGDGICGARLLHKSRPKHTKKFHNGIPNYELVIEKNQAKINTIDIKQKQPQNKKVRHAKKKSVLYFNIYKWFMCFGNDRYILTQSQHQIGAIS